MERIFDGKKAAKLGTEKNPAAVTVQTKKRMKEVESIFKKNGWQYSIELQPDKPEDIADLEILQNPQQTVIAAKVPVPCGSAKLEHLNTLSVRQRPKI